MGFWGDWYRETKRVLNEGSSKQPTKYDFWTLVEQHRTELEKISLRNGTPFDTVLKMWYQMLLADGKVYPDSTITICETEHWWDSREIDYHG